MNAQGNYAEDYVHDSQALGLVTLENWILETRQQPAWRWVANREAQYYDNNQLDADILVEMRNRGIPALTSNLIGPTVDLVLGMEAKTRSDPKVEPFDDKDVDIAAALNVKLLQAKHVADADRAISDAYASQIKVGVGWVEVGRPSDPFDAKYRIQSVHRREIWWDWLARDYLLSDARYLIRRRWTDTDVAELMFPDFKDLIRNVSTGWSNFSPMVESTTDDQWLGREYAIEQDTSLEEMEWLDMHRDRIGIYEVWYRKWVRHTILRLPGDMVVEYDPKNPMHRQAVAMNLVQPEMATYPKMRLSWWVGPHRIMDSPSPYAHNRFPYVPFFGKREDRTGVPYGLIRPMMSPQDEINARKSKMMWLLSAKRVIADEDAVLDHEAAAEEVSRPDAYIKLNRNRLNKTETAFRVENDLALNSAQMQALEVAKLEVQDVAGVYQQMLGKDVAGGAKSGIAINSLVEQGTTTLAEMNDNYRVSRAATFELLLSMVKQDIGRDSVAVVVDRETGKERTVHLNALITDPKTDLPLRTNDIARTKMRVALEPIPSTPTYRAQVMMQLSELVKSLPPNLQEAVIDIVIKAYELPPAMTQDIVDRVRAVTGVQKPLDKMTPQEQQAAQAHAAEILKKKQLEEALVEATLAERQASARRAEAQALQAEGTADQTEATSILTLVQADQLAQTTDHSVETHALDVEERLHAQRLREQSLPQLPGSPPPQTTNRESAP